jgi:hypothetical protein
VVHFAHLAVVLLGFGGGLGVDVVLGQQLLQPQALLLCQVGYRFFHLNYNCDQQSYYIRLMAGRIGRQSVLLS